MSRKSLEKVNDVVRYNNNVYEEVKYWYPAFPVEDKKVTLTDFGESFFKELKSIRIKTYENDPENLFISYRNILFEWDLYHKVSDPLPDYHNVDEVEKIILDFQELEKTVELKDEMLLQALDFIKECENNLGQQIIRPWNKEGGSASIKIYFQDNYPAYFDYGAITQSDDNRWGINGAFTHEISSAFDVAVFPESLTQYIDEQLQLQNNR